MPTPTPKSSDSPHASQPASPSQFFNNSIFWIEIEKVKPNPYQPRRDFDEERLRDLSESIRMYGILQPLVVTRNEIIRDDGGLSVEYELISGERRLRASKLAGLSQVPALIRNGEEDARVKLELAIIENLQREDLNAVDRARAFARLVEEFDFTHGQIGTKVGKSREYVSNTLRILALPSEMLDALSQGHITEGHSRPLLMLGDRPDEQNTLFREIVMKKLTVREAEGIGRRIAYDKVRKKDRGFDPELVEIEEKLTERLGTRVQIERRGQDRGGGGKIHIDFFTNDDLRALLELMEKTGSGVAAVVVEQKDAAQAAGGMGGEQVSEKIAAMGDIASALQDVPEAVPLDDRSAAEKKASEETTDDDDLYSIKNFVI